MWQPSLKDENFLLINRTLFFQLSTNLLRNRIRFPEIAILNRYFHAELNILSEKEIKSETNN